MNKVHIEGEMTIYRAAELKEQVLAPLKDAGPIEIDLSAVSEIDSVGVQLLLLARRDAQAQQRPLRLLNLSPAVVDAFELLDLHGHFH
jgi:anti-anti-sigma factor